MSAGRFVSVSELAKALFGSGEGAILVLRAYFDDAGKSKNDDVVAWAGFVGTTHSWDYLDGLWRERLADPLGDGSRPRLEKGFHLSDCVGPIGRREFADYSSEEREKVRWRFRELIPLPDVMPNGLFMMLREVGYAAYCPDYDELVYGDVLAEMGGPDVSCIVSCIKTAVNVAKSWDPRGLAIFVDRGAYTPAMATAVDHLLDGYVGSVAPVTVTGAAVAEFTGLQIADTLATELRWYAKKMRNEGDITQEQNEHLNDLRRKLTRIAPAGVFVMRREEIESNVAKVRKWLEEE